MSGADDSIISLRDMLLEQLAKRVEAKLLRLFNLGIDPATVGRSGTVMVEKGLGQYAFREDFDLSRAERMSPERKADVAAALLATGHYRADHHGRIERTTP